MKEKKKEKGIEHLRKTIFESYIKRYKHDSSDFKETLNINSLKFLPNPTKSNQGTKPDPIEIITISKLQQLFFNRWWQWPFSHSWGRPGIGELQKTLNCMRVGVEHCIMPQWTVGLGLLWQQSLWMGKHPDYELPPCTREGTKTNLARRSQGTDIWCEKLISYWSQKVLKRHDMNKWLQQQSAASLRWPWQYYQFLLLLCMFHWGETQPNLHNWKKWIKALISGYFF